METAVHAIPALDDIEDEPKVEPAARTATVKRMFQYSTFIDIGDGAEECEHNRDGECDDIEHFHAWCRLPNPYQHQDIRAKGMAAKARRIRVLKDPESDPSVVLDNQLSDLDAPEFVDRLADELVARDWTEDYLQAQLDVEEREEYTTITQDREEFARLDEAELPEAEQSQAYRELGKHMRGYLDALRKRLEEIQRPKREEYRALEPAAAAALMRSKHVEEEADRAFIDEYNAWTWFVGTFKVDIDPLIRRPSKPMWDDIGRRDRPAAGTMFGEAPEVIEGLRATFNELQLAHQRGSAGNS